MSFRKDIEIRASALKHGHSVNDVYSVFNTFILNRMLDDRDRVELVLGFSTKGELLELFFEDTEQQYVVFHLMKCRKQFINLLAEVR